MSTVSIPFKFVSTHDTFVYRNVQYRKLSDTFAAYPHHHQLLSSTLPSDLVIFQADEKVEVLAQ